LDSDDVGPKNDFDTDGNNNELILESMSDVSGVSKGNDSQEPLKRVPKDDLHLLPTLNTSIIEMVNKT